MEKLCRSLIGRVTWGRVVCNALCRRPNLLLSQHSVRRSDTLPKTFRGRTMCTALGSRKGYSQKYRLPPGLDRWPSKCLSTASGALSMRDELVKRYVLHLRDTYNKANEELMKGDTHGNHGIVTALKPIVALAEQYLETESELVELQEIVKDCSVEDPEMAELAQKDMVPLEFDLHQLDKRIIGALVPTEAVEEMDIMIELSAGVGGQEAMLFTAELFDMYRSYAAHRGWQFETLKIDQSDIGGYRQANAAVRGAGVYRHMKFEGGVHRVQRVPKTERHGRIHTSTMAVAIMPMPTEIEVVLDPKELQMTYKTASGAGGQHVNKTLSCVRVVHLPTGITVECQAERSGERNKQIALQMLRTRIYAKEMEDKTKILKSRRKLQVGTLGRSEKIRTYNYQQDRISDHRVGGNLYGVERFLVGGEEVDTLIEKLLDFERTEKLKELLEDFREQYSIELQKKTNKN